jgi:arylsulfatase A-like enzyme
LTVPPAGPHLHGVNILLVTLDQFRGDCLSAAGHPVVRTPHLDRLAREGVRLARHYSQAAPCGPGRASLYTGLYQMNHRVVANGTPLDRRFDNIAKAARRGGYAPTLFGYTDQAIDPRDADGPGDPRLSTYEGVLPGFDVGLAWGTGAPGPWLAWLRGLGHPVPDDIDAALEGEPGRPADHSLSAFHTDVFLGWLDRQTAPWFAHLSQLRPHPPYAAAGPFSTMYGPAALAPPIAADDDRHRLHDGLLRNPRMAAPGDHAVMARVMAQYFGMVSEADHQLGRIWAALEARGEWDDTFIVVTADHGEQLGDHGLIGKSGFFEQSYHIVGLIRDPRPAAVRGAVVDAFTENVDVFPTLCEAMGVAVPAQCDGASLTPFLVGRAPAEWRDAAHWEFDWRVGLIQQTASDPLAPPLDGRLERRSLAVRRAERAAYVHFADGSWLGFDLAADPTWRTPLTDPALVLEQAQALLTWRARHADRTLTGMLAERGGLGRWPEMPSDWGAKAHAAA